MAVLDVGEFFPELQELGTMLFIFVVYHYLVKTVIYNLVHVSLLNRFVYFNLLETAVRWFLLIVVDEVSCTARWWIWEILVILYVDYF